MIRTAVSKFTDYISCKYTDSRQMSNLVESKYYWVYRQILLSMMNPIRLTADMLHLLSFFILIHKIRRTQNCIGLSLKTQGLYLIVFCSRYIDLYFYWDYQTYYLLIMKVIFICATAYTIYLIRFAKPYSSTYDSKEDDFPCWITLVPGALLAAIAIHRDWTVLDLIWSFSIWLETVTILPQLSMLYKKGEVENITGNYVAAVGIYRMLYVCNWVYRYYYEDFFCLTSVCGGILQSVLYVDFLYHYIKALAIGKSGKNIQLPTVNGPIPEETNPMMEENVPPKSDPGASLISTENESTVVKAEISEC